MVEFLCVGDTHADGMPPCIPKKLSAKAVPDVLDQALHYSVQNNINNIILLGDIFDGYPGTMASHITYIDFFLKAHKEKIAVYCIDGNHGFISNETTSLDLLHFMQKKNILGDCHIFTKNPAVEKVDGTDVVFLPWPHNKVKGLVKKPCLVFAHCQRPNLKTASGYKLKDVEDFDLGNHFWVIGDNHEPQKGKGFIYPGAPLQLKFGDSKKRHFLHIDYKSGKKPKVKYVPIALPYILSVITAETSEDLEKLNDRKDNEWTKVKSSREILSNAGKITKKWPRVIIEPMVKETIKTEHVEKSRDLFIDSWEFRSKLLTDRMKGEGLSKSQIKRGLKLALTAEERMKPKKKSKK